MEEKMTYMRKSFSLLIMIFIVSNFAVANVTVSIGDVQVDGYTDDIVVPVTLANPENWFGGLQFDLIAMPTIVTLSGATPADQSSFSADYTVFNDTATTEIYTSLFVGSVRCV